MNQGALLLAARKYEGQCEEPRGSNWGSPTSVVVRSLALVHLDHPASWCAAFACLCVYEGNGGSFPAGFRPSASALKLWELNPLLRIDKREIPDVEDLAIYDHGGGHGHVDIVEMTTQITGKSGYWFRTLGGNTNKGGGRQGIGVFGGISRTSEDPLLVGFLRVVGRA